MTFFSKRGNANYSMIIIFQYSCLRSLERKSTKLQLLYTKKKKKKKDPSFAVGFDLAKTQERRDKVPQK